MRCRTSKVFLSQRFAWPNRAGEDFTYSTWFKYLHYELHTKNPQQRSLPEALRDSWPRSVVGVTGQPNWGVKGRSIDERTRLFIRGYVGGRRCNTHSFAWRLSTFCTWHQAPKIPPVTSRSEGPATGRNGVGWIWVCKKGKWWSLWFWLMLGWVDWLTHNNVHDFESSENYFNNVGTITGWSNWCWK